MILAVCGMCDYKHQIAVSQTMINLKGELQEVCIASRRVWWNAKLCRTWVTGTFLKGHRKLVREWFCGCSSRITEFQGLFFSLSAPHLTPSPPPHLQDVSQANCEGGLLPAGILWIRNQKAGRPHERASFFLQSGCRCVQGGNENGEILPSLRCNQEDCAMQQSISGSCFLGKYSDYLALWQRWMWMERKSLPFRSSQSRKWQTSWASVLCISVVRFVKVSSHVIGRVFYYCACWVVVYTDYFSIELLYNHLVLDLTFHSLFRQQGTRLYVFITDLYYNGVTRSHCLQSYPVLL